MNEIQIITHTSHETIISGDFDEGSLVIRFYTEGIAPPGTYAYSEEEQGKFNKICSRYLTELKVFVEENHKRIKDSAGVNPFSP